MKTAILSLALALSLSATAQQAAPLHPATIDLHLAGQHIEKAGKQRNAALITTLTAAALGGMAMAMDSENATPAGAIIGIGAVVGLTLNIGANGHERKAGRILQGR